MTLNELASRSACGGDAPERARPQVRGSHPARRPAALLVFVLAASVLACGEAPENGEEQPAGEQPRVYFEQPQNGATVSSPVEVVFGSENIEIGAVPDDVETPREGVVHYHLGYDTECLPPGTIVPEADPWIHFGDGSDRIEMELQPGDYLLTVQAGDDEHRTVEGLCETIQITVADRG